MKFPIFVVGVMVASVASAMLKVSPYFSDNGVVQCDMKARVFGVARPASKVTVEFKGQKKTAVTGSDWRWTAELDPLKADAKGATMTITDGKKTIIVTNLLVGEVWFACGQSNMEMPMWGKNPKFRQTDGDKIAAAGADDSLRMLDSKPIDGISAPDFRKTVNNKHQWVAATPESIEKYSATAYLFARELRRKLKVPVGIIAAYCGGTNIELWTPPCGYNKGIESLNYLRDRVNGRIPGTAEYHKFSKRYMAECAQWFAEFRKQNETEVPMYAEIFNEINLKYSKWYAEFAAAYYANQRLPHPPELPKEFKIVPEPPKMPSEIKVKKGWNVDDTTFYNYMVDPFAPASIRGLIFYQGCNNLSSHARYADLMEAFYLGWCEEFKNEKLPFYYVQVAPYAYGRRRKSGDMLPCLWEAQSDFEKRYGKQVGMAVINDVGNIDDIHPYDKRKVAERLAAYAFNRTYAMKDVACEFPKLASYEIKGGKFVLRFMNVTEFKRAAAKPRFELAGADGVKHPAKFEIKGSEIIVSSDKVTAPTVLYYGWDECCEAALTNEHGLPLTTFRCPHP